MAEGDAPRGEYLVDGKCKICGRTEAEGHKEDCPVFEYQQHIEHHSVSEQITPEFEKKNPHVEGIFERQMAEVHASLEKMAAPERERLAEREKQVKEIFVKCSAELTRLSDVVESKAHEQQLHDEYERIKNRFRDLIDVFDSKREDELSDPEYLERVFGAYHFLLADIEALEEKIGFISTK